MNSLGVSFIIASYNCSEYVSKAIHSALAQEGCSVEVIVVDDGSTDGTEEVIADFRVGDVKYYKLDENKGPSYARNFALKMATKDWFAILDADDWVEPERCKILIEHAIKHQCDIVSDDQVLIDHENGSCLGLRSKNIPFLAKADPWLDVDFHALIKNPSLGIIQPVFSKRVLETVSHLYDESLVYGEDYDLLVRLLESGSRLSVLKKALYNVRVREGSLVSDRVKTYEGMIKVYHKLMTRKVINNDADMRSFLLTHIRSAERTVVYGRVVDNLKRKNFSLALTACFRHPEFFLQLPARVLSKIKKIQ